MGNTRKQIEVGDTVRCIGEQIEWNVGWEKDLVFEVDEIRTFDGTKIYFGGKDGHGVFKGFLELVKKRNQSKDMNNYFPFLVGDKLKSPLAYDKNGKRNHTKNSLGELRPTDEAMEITAIGNTMFLAVHDGNERLYSKLNEYEMHTPLEKF